MILTNNNNGTYTIDLASLTKSTYNLSTVLKINDVQVSTTLPYVWTPIDGINEIYFKLTNINGTYEEKRCVFIDINNTLYCKIITKLSTLNEEDKLKNQMPYYYYLLKDSLDTDGVKCDCLCSGLKDIYSTLVNLIEDDGCC